MGYSILLIPNFNNLKPFYRLPSHNSRRKIHFSQSSFLPEFQNKNSNHIQPISTIKTHACMDYMTYNTYTVPNQTLLPIRTLILLTNWAPKVKSPSCSVVSCQNAPAGFQLLKFAPTMINSHLWSLMGGLDEHAKEKFEG